MIKIYKYRVKNLHGQLNRMSRAVNYVWNFCNDTQKHALKWGKKWPSNYDLHKLTSGSYKKLGINSGVINATCTRYSINLRAKRKAYLRYRGRRSLGWIPFRGSFIVPVKGGFRFQGKVFRVWMSRELPQTKILDGGCFSRDARGNWYLHIPIEVKDNDSHKTGKFIGIDLGLKSLAALSNGEEIPAPRYFRKSQIRLASAQRARKKKLIQKIHAKIVNQRQDFLHKASTNIAKRFGFIAVGNVKSSKLAKTRMAKSVLDAGWYRFRKMLNYKAIALGGLYTEVNESYSSIACSGCGAFSGPKGRKGLCIREWTCSECGAAHNRDVNADLNILHRAYPMPIVGDAESIYTNKEGE